ncbi:MAG: betaine-aldehyde dehydrogenase, partial [Crocinitomicaceae bacterium]
MNKKEKWPLSPSLESTQHISLQNQYNLYIDGKWVKPSSGVYFSTKNPADESHLASIAHANEKDVDNA